MCKDFVVNTNEWLAKDAGMVIQNLFINFYMFFGLLFEESKAHETLYSEDFASRMLVNFLVSMEKNFYIHV